MRKTTGQEMGERQSCALLTGPEWLCQRASTNRNHSGVLCGPQLVMRTQMQTHQMQGKTIGVLEFQSTRREELSSKICSIFFTSLFIAVLYKCDGCPPFQIVIRLTFFTSNLTPPLVQKICA